MATSNSTPRQLRKPFLGLALAAASLVTLSACSSGYADTDTGSTATFQEERGNGMIITQIGKDGEVRQFRINPTDDNDHDEDEKAFADSVDGRIVSEEAIEILPQSRMGELSEDETTVLWDDGETSSVQITDDVLVMDGDSLQSFNSDASIDRQEDIGYTR